MSVNVISGMLKADGMRFGIAVSRFNDLLTKQLLAGATDCLVRHGTSESSITVAWVPGSDELPLAIDQLAGKSSFNALIALGVVIQGSTTHAAQITNQVSNSLARIAHETRLPIINGVVSTETLEQAIERTGTKAGNKGWQAAQAAIEMANVYKGVVDSK